MKQSLRRAVACTGAIFMMAMLALPSTAAESKPLVHSQVMLENTYDAEVSWNNGALFIKNGSLDSITDQTQMKLLKPDGSITDFTNKNKFDKIYAALSGSLYTCNSDYLIVGKDGKKALLKDDGSFVNDTTYDDIVTASDHYMALKENGRFVVRKLDSTLVKAYSNVQNMHLYETDHSLIVTDSNKVIGLFDTSLKEIDLSGYTVVYYDYSIGDFLRIVSASGSIGYIDDTGKRIVPSEYSFTIPFSYKGVTYFEAINYDNNTNSYSIFNADGSMLINKSDGSMDAYNVNDTNGYVVFDNGESYGIFDFNTKTNKIEPEYDQIYGCTDQYFAYSKDGKIGVKTYDGKVIFESDQYSSDKAYIYVNDKYIVVNVLTDRINMEFTADVYSITGKFLFSTDEYSYVRCDANVGLVGYFYSKTDTKPITDILDDEGNRILSSDSYDDFIACSLSNIKSYFYLIVKDGKVGIVDPSGRAILEADYQSLGKFSSGSPQNQISLFTAGDPKNTYICTKQKDKYGLIEISPLISATGLCLDKTEASLKTGETVMLTPKFIPADATDQTVTWSSSDETVATVKDGVVTALKAGNVTITATTADSGLKASCTVNVTEVTTTATTNTTEPANAISPTDSTQNNTNPTATQEAIKSPATGESPAAAGIAFAVLAVSSLAAGLALKKK